MPYPRLFRCTFLSQGKQFAHSLHTVNNQRQFILFRQFHLFFKHSYLKLHRSSSQLIQSGLTHSHQLFFCKLLPKTFQSTLRIKLRQIPRVNTGRIEISFAQSICRQLTVNNRLPGRNRFCFMGMNIQNIICIPFHFPHFGV